jgi:dUTPase
MKYAIETLRIEEYKLKEAIRVSLNTLRGDGGFGSTGV